MNNEQREALVPVGVGNTPAQQRFFQGHPRFLAETPKLVELCNKIFDRTLEPPDANERQALWTRTCRMMTRPSLSGKIALRPAT